LRDLVCDGVSEDVLEGILRRDVVAGTTDHDGELDLPVHLAGHARVKRISASGPMTLLAALEKRIGRRGGVNCCVLADVSSRCWR
jgi:hypothetical protein